MTLWSKVQSHPCFKISIFASELYRRVVGCGDVSTASVAQNHTLPEMSARVEKCEESVFHTTGQMNQDNQKGFGPLDERSGVGGGGGGSGLQGLEDQV